MNIKIKTLALSLFLYFGAFAQNISTHEINFEWGEKSFVSDLVTEENDLRLIFKNAVYNQDNPYLPNYALRIPVSGNGDLKVAVEEISFLDESPFQEIEKNNYITKIIQDLDQQIQFFTRVDQNRQNFFGKVSFCPIVKDNMGQIRFVKNIKINISHKQIPILTQRTPPKENSVLREGDIYKLKISKSGIHKLTGKYLQNTLGIKISDLDVSKIQLFGMPGGKLEFANNVARIDDLLEFSILVNDGGDSKFDENDEIFFYAEAAERWDINENGTFQYHDNPFDIDNYVFLRIGVQNGKRISTIGTSVSDIKSFDSYMELQRYELNRVNLLDEKFGTQGTGQEWFGEYFDIQKVIDFSNKFSVTNIVESAEANIKMRFAGRANSSSTVKLTIGNQSFTKSISSVNLTSYTSDHARFANFNENFVLQSANPKIEIDYSANSNAVGWLDYIELQFPRKLIMTNNQMIFNNSTAENINQFNLKISNTNSNSNVWNITNIDDIYQQNSTLTGDITSFTTDKENIYKFIIFNSNSSLLEPVFSKKIENQNLHNIMSADMIIVTHHSLKEQAERLMEHRKAMDGFDIKLVEVEEIFNEFSSGRHEPTAIRDFFKMVYDRDPSFKYGLLFGNASFDYKGIKHDRDQNNLVPIFETVSGMNAIKNFPCDDFFGLLSIQDGDDLRGEVDLGIGRIPVSNLSQAKIVIDKIIKYDTDPTLRGPWNLRSGFAADDEDGNAHINPADQIAEGFLKENPDINLEKIYWDSYVQVSTPGGERYPTVTEDINGNIFKGLLTFCYMGHGGPSGWSQERVLQLKDIDNWSNERSFPLFITATCSLASIDDPEVFSAGEKILVNKNGGIALFTTCRAVYSSDNTRLTTSVFDFILAEENNDHLRLGEILRRSKNNEFVDTVDVNARKFLLLGDPSMKLLYPEYDVVTTSINDIDVTQTSFTDTIRALSKMKIKGFVSDQGNIISNYNGEIHVTVFDKRTERKTLGQDSRSIVRNFFQQKNLLFTGKAQVTNGVFELEFIVPKDILYTVGAGKISYFATNGEIDARGHYNEFLVGGTSANPVEDDTPPLVQVFMNNEDFVLGGQTSPNPILYAKITDDLGINLSGSSIGHDLTGNLDDNSQKTYFLNDFYESELNDFTKGVVQYPLNNLENGKHKIKVRAWDIANNVGEGYTEFVVSDNLKDGLTHVLNYPNPFTDNTCFMFEHNFAPDVLEVEISIYTTSGKLVKSILHNTVSDGFRVDNVKWDGTDDYGSEIGRGVYLYKIKVKANSQNTIKESGFEKLVILK